MIENNPIKCPHCKKDSGYTQESLRYYVMPKEGLQCKECGKTIMLSRKPVWQSAKSSSGRYQCSC